MFSQKIAIVTGGTTGIGKAVAFKLLSKDISVIITDDEILSNILFIFNTFSQSHLEISGNLVNFEQLLNKKLIFSILFAFQIEISGK